MRFGGAVRRMELTINMNHCDDQPDKHFIPLQAWQLDEIAKQHLRFLAATLAGIAGYLFSGNLRLEAKIPLNKTKVRATRAFAAFALVLILFYVGVPSK